MTGGVASVALVIMAAVSAPETPPAEGWDKTTSQSFETIEPGGRVRVVNLLGSIHARFGGYENQVEILATVQRRPGDPTGPQVSIVPADGGLAVTTRSTSDPPAAGEPRSRVDLVLFVPLGAVLDAETRADTIEAKGLRGDVIASTFTGNIRVRSVTGSVQAKSVRGPISAHLETGVTQEPQDFFTETGEIEIYLWEDADVHVDIATSGEISTDFSMTVEHHRKEEPGKHAVATVGDGGPRLSLYSKRGRIRLLRLERDHEPES